MTTFRTIYKPSSHRASIYPIFSALLRVSSQLFKPSLVPYGIHIPEYMEVVYDAWVLSCCASDNEIRQAGEVRSGQVTRAGQVSPQCSTLGNSTLYILPQTGRGPGAGSPTSRLCPLPWNGRGAEPRLMPGLNKVQFCSIMMSLHKVQFCPSSLRKHRV